MKIEPRKTREAGLTTGLVRLGFNHLMEATPATAEINPGKYDACLLIDKSTPEGKATVKMVRECIAEAIAKGIAERWGGKKPSRLREPLRDGDDDRGAQGTPVNEGQFAAVYQGCFFVNAKSNSRPDVVDRKLNAILDKEEVYAGCRGVASLSFFPYKNSGNCGVGCAINSFVKVKDGDPIAGKPTAQSEFKGCDFGSDEDDDI